MYAIIVNGLVSEVTESLPGPGCMFMECNGVVRPGWRVQVGVLAAPDPDEAILAQIAELEAMQTPRLLREAMMGLTCTVNKPGCCIHGLTPEEALTIINAQAAALRAQLAKPMFYQSSIND